MRSRVPAASPAAARIVSVGGNIAAQHMDVSERLRPDSGHQSTERHRRSHSTPVDQGDE